MKFNRLQRYVWLCVCLCLRRMFSVHTLLLICAEMLKAFVAGHRAAHWCVVAGTATPHTFFPVRITLSIKTLFMNDNFIQHLTLIIKHINLILPLTSVSSCHLLAAILPPISHTMDDLYPACLRAAHFHVCGLHRLSFTGHDRHRSSSTCRRLIGTRSLTPPGSVSAAGYPTCVSELTRPARNR